MDIEVLKNGGIDYDAGLTRFLGDADLYEAVLTAFAEDDVAARARDNYDKHDFKALLSTVHEAKGTSGNMELHKAYKLASDLVALLRSDAYTDKKISELFLLFENEYLCAQACARKALNF